MAKANMPLQICSIQFGPSSVNIIDKRYHLISQELMHFRLNKVQITLLGLTDPCCCCEGLLGWGMLTCLGSCLK